MERVSRKVIDIDKYQSNRLKFEKFADDDEKFPRVKFEFTIVELEQYRTTITDRREKKVIVRSSQNL